MLAVIIVIRLQSPGKRYLLKSASEKTGTRLFATSCGQCIRELRSFRRTRCKRQRLRARRASSPLKIDELPQLWNVLIGDRAWSVPGLACRPDRAGRGAAPIGVLKMRPGITGLAQVRGVDMSDLNSAREIDAQYVRTQSLLGDFRLIWPPCAAGCWRRPGCPIRQVNGRV